MLRIEIRLEDGLTWCPADETVVFAVDGKGTNASSASGGCVRCGTPDVIIRVAEAEAEAEAQTRSIAQICWRLSATPEE